MLRVDAVDRVVSAGTVPDAQFPSPSFRERQKAEAPTR